MKKLSFLFILLVLLSLLASCDNGGAENAISSSSGKAVKVSLHMFSADPSAQKTLAITSGTADISNIAYYEYRAIPQWTSEDWNSVKGTQTSWTSLDQDESIWFTQGLWHIEVKAYAIGGIILCEGSLDCYISSQVNSLEIPIRRLVGNGQIDISITVPELSVGGALTLDYSTFGGQTEVFSNFNESRANNVITYTATIQAAAGSYILSFMFGDSNVDFRYGETYVAEVFANMTTSVTGDLALGTLVRAGNTSESYSDKDKAVTFVCLNDADTYAWYVNDVLQQNTDQAFFTYTPTAYNTYTIKCKLNNSDSAANIGTARLIVRTAITIYLHFENDALLEYNTYTNTISKSDLSGYLTSMYVQNWYTAAENGSGGGGSVYNSNSNFTADTHLYAHRNYYTITFNKNTNNNSVSVSPSTIKGYHGTALGTLPSISISGTSFSNIFDGWYTDSNANGTKVDASTIITGTTTYYAKWTTASIGQTENGKYNVVFAVYDHSEVPGYFHWNTRDCIVKVNTGSKLKKSDVPSTNKLVLPNGYSQVDGWYRNREYDAEDNALLSDKWDFDNDVVNSHMILYANPVKDSDKRTISFETYGGSTINSMTVYCHATADAPANPSRAGSKFMGWFKDAQYTQPWHFETDYVYDKMTLHALWLSPDARDYLENTSQASDVCIDTGIVPTDNTRVVITFDYAGDQDVTLVGTESPEWGIHTDHVRKTFVGVYGNENIRATEVDYNSSRVKRIMEFSANSGFKVDGALYGRPSSSGLSAGGSICIFRAPGDAYSAVGKCYSVQIYSGASLVRNLVPYHHPDSGVYGLYDTVGGGFYHSSGSSQLVGGNDSP